MLSNDVFYLWQIQKDVSENTTSEGVPIQISGRNSAKNVPSVTKITYKS